MESQPASSLSQGAVGLCEVRDGTIAVAVSVDILEGLLNFAERVANLLP